MRDASPGVVRVTPDREVGEQAREGHPAVFVLDKHGTPLQPTTSARARKLLKRGRAVVTRHTPFVIRLKDRAAAESSVDGVELGIDPGSKHTGMAVFTAQEGERRGRYSIQLNHRGATIRKKMQQRAAYRGSRRTRNLRYRAPRFHNRTRPKGWLAPSLRHRVGTTLSWVDRLARWAPIQAVHVERIAFDVHAISVGRQLEGAEYQHGTLHGTEVREYLLVKWSRACAYCGVTEVPLNIDHIHPRGRGGSDRVSNLCAPPVSPVTRLRAAAPSRSSCPSPRASSPASSPVGRNAGTYIGRIAVRASGSFNIRTATGLYAVRHKYCRLLQRADGYGYTTQPEERQTLRRGMAKHRVPTGSEP